MSLAKLNACIGQVRLEKYYFETKTSILAELCGYNFFTVTFLFKKLQAAIIQEFALACNTSVGVKL